MADLGLWLGLRSRNWGLGVARISVVVPVYNSEAYLPECLDSLERQTLSDIEIICVNDGSPDGSARILTDYAGHDPRICVIEKGNGGLSSARNAGMRAASAPLVSFLDSDDRYLPQTCERIVQVLEESGADVLTFGGSAWPESESYPWLEEVLSPRDVTYEGFTPDILLHEASKPFAWRMALRSSFVRDRGISFDESLRYGEDQVFAFAVYPRSSITRLIPDKLYDYRIVHGDSLLNRMLEQPKDMLMTHIDMERRILDDWKSMGILERYAASQLEWICELILFDALRLPDAECEDIYRRTRDVLLVEWDSGITQTCGLASGYRRLIDAAYKGQKMSKVQRTSLMTSYYVAHNGWKALGRRIVHGARKTHA